MSILSWQNLQRSTNQHPWPDSHQHEFGFDGFVHFLPYWIPCHQYQGPVWHQFCSPALLLPRVLWVDNCWGCLAVHQISKSLWCPVSHNTIHSQCWTSNLEWDITAFIILKSRSLYCFLTVIPLLIVILSVGPGSKYYHNPSLLVQIDNITLIMSLVHTQQVQHTFNIPHPNT